MSDIVELDGTPWVCCPRSFLKAGAGRLQGATRAVSCIASLRAGVPDAGRCVAARAAFALQAQRRADPFGPAVMAALRDAASRPEVFIPEYGKDQFEITTPPAEALAAADRAVVLRETVRELSRNGWQLLRAQDGGRAWAMASTSTSASPAPRASRPHDAAQPGGCRTSPAFSLACSAICRRSPPSHAPAPSQACGCSRTTGVRATPGSARATARRACASAR